MGKCLFFLKVRYSHALPGVFMMGENVFELNWPDSHSGRSYGLMVMVWSNGLMV